MAEPAQVLASLPPRTRADLTTRSDSAGLMHLAKHASIILVLAGYVAAGLPLWWVALLPLGIALVFVFTLQHECTHQTPFRSIWLNELVGHICAVLIAQPFLWFRAFHLAHHRHTNDPHKDPELAGDAKLDSWSAFAWHLGTLGYWASKLCTLHDNARGSFVQAYMSPRAHTRLKTESRLLITLYAAAALLTLTVSPILVWIWALPLMLEFPVLRLYLLAEHGRCPQVANMFENSRTTLTNKVVKLLAWNMPYHAEHHAYPNVPFHKLPDARAVAAPHLAVIADGDLAFTKTYTLPLK
jgi:fatty acid desaturase